MAHVGEKRSQNVSQDWPFRTRLVELVRERHAEALLELPTMQSSDPPPQELESTQAVGNVAGRREDHQRTPFRQPEPGLREPATSSVRRRRANGASTGIATVSVERDASRMACAREPVAQQQSSASRVHRSASFLRDDGDEEEERRRHRDEHRRLLLERWRSREF